MSDDDKPRLLPIVIVWTIIAAIGAGVYKFVIAEDEKTEIENVGITELYDHQIKIAHDSFSGYAVLRSTQLKDRLAKEKVGLIFNDDGADYTARLKALQDGDADMAVFTVDALVKASVALGDYPATIVLVIDETRGADAMVGYKGQLPNAQAIEKDEARVVLTPDSPSETLARVLFAHFSFPDPFKKRMDGVDGAGAVYKRLVDDGADSPHAYVLWEPFVSKALEDERVHVLLDSSQLRGYIVDVLVVSRRYLKNNEPVVKTLVESYLRAAYQVKKDEAAFRRLILDDAKAYGDGLSDAQAKRLIAGVHWKNTTENYAHFGIVPPERSRGLSNLVEIIRNIVTVQVKTGALEENPLVGKENTLFYDGVLKALKEATFHPGQELSLIEGMEGPAAETIQGDAELKELSDAEWDSLIEVGELRIEPIAFARGRAKISNPKSKRDLAELAQTLSSWPHVYLKIMGHARAEGDAEANRLLAEQRAEAARAALQEHGVAAQRMRVMTAKPSQRGGAAQSVSFVAGQRAY